ncbi:diguanylate cyclase domain-containing protein [Lachnospira sp.]|uniref:diguanylate cyclase domain-containing protein n=1 Tax=Lachnospira sp. TaxID=2049031 RepID=UPI0025797EDB|nr:diguanylate cyclase [Lachnospira sp.]
MGYDEKDEFYLLAEEDAITGLLNRRGGEEEINDYIKEHPDEKCAYIIFECDKFKNVKDTFGHKVSDKIITESADEISKYFLDKGIVIRMDSDEFVVFYINTDKEEVKEKLDKFIEDQKPARMINGMMIPFTFSIGVTMYPEHGKNFAELLEKADIALYDAKYRGRARYTIYEKGFVNAHQNQLMFGLEEFSKSLPGGFFVYEAKGDEKILYANQSMVELFKCDDMNDFRKYIGNSFKGIVHPDEYDKVLKEINTQQGKSDNHGNLDYIRYRIKCKDGTEKLVDDFGHLVNDPTFGMIYYVFLLDVDEHIVNR